MDEIFYLYCNKKLNTRNMNSCFITVEVIYMQYGGIKKTVSEEFSCIWKYPFKITHTHITSKVFI